MNHPRFVRRFQRFRDLTGDRERLLDIQCTGFDSLGQRLAGDQFHHQIMNTLGLLQPVNRRNVRVVQRGQHLRFVLKTSQPTGVVCERCRKNFDGHIAPELGVVGAIHFPCRKYPNAGLELGWFWVFPSRTLSTDPRTGVVRRHHMHDSVIQKAVSASLKRKFEGYDAVSATADLILKELTGKE